MGLFSKLFGNNNADEKQNTYYAPTMNGTTPIFTQFGTNIYASDVVQQAIDCIASEMAKLNPEHVVGMNGDETIQKSNIAKVLKNPNVLMTTSDFLYKITSLLFLNSNAFIVPTYLNVSGKKIFKELYPVVPSQVDFLQDVTGHYYLKFYFNAGEHYTVDYDDVIHLRIKYGANDFMGGDANGRTDNTALLQTLNINHQILQGIEKGAKAMYAVNGVFKYNTMMDAGKVEKSMKKFEERLKKSESGFMGLDLKNDFVPIKKDIKLVDSETLKFIDEKILRTWGISYPIITGDYTKEQYESFYQKSIERLVILFSQAFSKVMLTEQQRENDEKIVFYPKDLIFMSVDQTLQMINLLGATGALWENEKRTALGLHADERLSGIRKMSLNYVDAEIANQYQLGKNGDVENGGNNDENI